MSRRFFLILLLGLCALPALAQNADNFYCPVSGVPTWGANDGPAQLPSTCLNTSLANTPATGAVINVTTSAQLTAALAAAVCGQKITLQAGNVFSGHFTIPALACPSTNWLWIQTSAVASLPAEGARYSTSYTGSGSVVQTLYAPQFGPCYAGVTSQIGRPPLELPRNPGNLHRAINFSRTAVAVLTFLPNTTNVRFIGLEITRTPGTGTNSSLVNLGNQGTGISGIYWDRVWAHGDENEDETGRWFTSSGVSNVAVVDCYCNNIYFISVIGTGTDSKCISGGANTVSSTVESGIKLVNNFIEAAGESFIYGGAGSNTVPINFEIRLNLFFKPLQWNPSDPSYNGGVSTHPFIVKNLGEFKNGNFILMEGNELINVWGGFTQIGHAFLVTPANQNGLCNVCFTGNVTARYNLANTVGASMELVTQAQNPYVAGNPLPAGGNHYSVHDWVIDNLNYATCYGCTNGATSEIYVDSAADPAQTLSYITVNHMTFVYAATIAIFPPTITSAIAIAGPLSSSSSVINNIAVTNNVMRTWGGTEDPFASTTVSCSQPPIASGAAMINACWVPNTFSGNCFVNNGSVSWPAGNVTSVATYSALFTSYNNGDGGNYVLAPGACKGAATDGSDPGANIAMLAAVIAGNPSPAPPPPTPWSRNGVMVE